MVSADRTLLVTSTSRTLTTAEKMALGDGRFDSDLLQDVARKHSRRLVAFDMERAARDAGTVSSAVMFGAIAASGVLPFAREHFEAVDPAVRARRRGEPARLRARLGRRARRRSATAARDAPAPAACRRRCAASAIAHPADDGVSRADARRSSRLGYARLVDFQDARVRRTLPRAAARSPRRGDERRSGRGARLRVDARDGALPRAVDGVRRHRARRRPQVRASRFARVRREVAAGDGDIVRIVDHFKPGVPEVAALLPPALGARLVAWDRRRQRAARRRWRWRCICAPTPSPAFSRCARWPDCAGCAGAARATRRSRRRSSAGSARSSPRRQPTGSARSKLRCAAG